MSVQMSIWLIFILSLISLAFVILLFFRKKEVLPFDELYLRFNEIQTKLDFFEKYFEKNQSSLREDFKLAREENQKIALENRSELSLSMKSLREEILLNLKQISQYNYNMIKGFQDNLNQMIKGFQDNLHQNLRSLNEIQKEKLEAIKKEQEKLLVSTENRLELMRQTVDEKLQRTLNERLGQSFQAVGKQLQAVQEGLGEMRNLAQDVGGLKKVLTNVKMRGGFGELQLSMLLEQILAPSQYEANVMTKKNSGCLVEFAIKLPGKGEIDEKVWIPIDAKFPRESYELLQTAYDKGDLIGVEAAKKQLELVIKKMASDIRDKYLDPPATTDFGILFLPFEGLYAEVVKKASLLEDLQRNYKVIVTGPTTLAAILNSLQMGFKTLAIQKRSGEVWKILGEVKTEFEKFGGLLSKAQDKLHGASKDLDEVMGVRTRAIERKLKGVEVLVETKEIPSNPTNLLFEGKEED